jgi:ribosomal protein S18 acetylase RimI-like enzyme
MATCMVGYEGHRAWINLLGVAPAHQRGGHGRALMEEAERLMRAAGCAKLNLQVLTTNLKVIAFYQRLGFATDNVVSLGKRLEPS